MKHNILFAFLLLLSCPLWGQDSLRLVPEDGPRAKAKARQLDPQKAWRWALLPGGGQIYNRRYWKLPIVYGGIGTLVYLSIDNRQKYQCYRQSYLAVVDSDPNTVNTCDPNLTDAQLKILRDAYRQQYEYSVAGLIGFYGLTILDAFVDAHLSSFDVSDDLSLHWNIGGRAALSGFFGADGISSGVTASVTSSTSAKKAANSSFLIIGHLCTSGSFLFFSIVFFRLYRLKTGDGVVIWTSTFTRTISKRNFWGKRGLRLGSGSTSCLR